MIIDNLDFRWTGVWNRPLETDSPLVVDSDAVLPLAIAGQSFKTIARQGGKVFDRHGRVQPVEFQASLPLDAFECFDTNSGSEIPGALISIAEDHTLGYRILCVT